MTLTATSNIPMEVFAQSDRKCGENLYWDMDTKTGVLSITGSGNMYDSQPDWFELRDYIKSVEFDGEITSIGNYAFYGCKSLKQINLPDSVKSIGGHAFAESFLTSVELPDNVKKIGEYAFENCIKLESITYPKSLEETGWKIFSGCERLVSITVPEGISELPDSVFSGAEALNDVTLPSSLKTIGSYSFYECKSLETISLPGSVKSIGSHAFAGSGITSISLPDTVTQIDDYAFENCAALEKVRYPKSLEKTGWKIFRGCGKFVSITVPEGVTELPDGVFSGAEVLNDVTLPSTLKTIKSSAFYECKSLKQITLPNSVKSIGGSAFAGSGITGLILPNSLTKLDEYAFENCSNLEGVFINENLLTMGYGVFENCEKVKVYCPQYSDIAIKLIDEGIAFKSSNSQRLNEKGILDYGKSYYVTQFSSNNNGGNTSVVCNYSIKETAFSQLRNCEICIRIPDSSKLVAKSLYLNGKLSTSYTEDNSGKYLTIPITSSSGKITFSLKLTESVDFASYALLRYTRESSSDHEIIGVISENTDIISINADEVCSAKTIFVSGVAPATKKVEIYVDNNLITSVDSNKVGYYESKIALPNPKSGQEYEIKSVSVSGDKKLVAKTSVLYSKDTPTVKKLEMEYNGVTYDLNQTSNFNATLVPGNDFKFRIQFDNTQNVNSVYVTSDRNNTTKSIEAEWDETEKAYIASGFFGEDRSYVPGTLSVSYNEKRDDEYTLAKGKEYYNEIVSKSNSKPSDVKTTVSNNEYGKKTYTYECVNSEKLGEYGLSKLVMVVDEVSKVDSNKLLKSYGFVSSSYDVYDYLLNDNGEKYIFKVIKDPSRYAMVIEDATSNDIVQLIVTECVSESAGNSLPYISETFGTIQKMIDINKEHEKLVANIESSDLTFAQKQDALKKAKELKADREAFAIATCALTMMAIAVNAPLAFSLLLAATKVSSDYFFDLRMYNILNSEAKANLIWCVDPSGYVYEGVTSNRLKGVKTTAYYIPYDSKVSHFWDSPNTDKAIIWDAKEYSQPNPMFTDSFGNYAWDVPEGWWQVKYELDGYETAYSEWMPVPPPQTNVNIGMVSYNAPTVIKTEVFDNRLEIVFDKYIDPKTASGIVIKDIDNKKIEYSVSYDKTQKDETGKVYANKIVLKYLNTSTISSIASISVPDSVKSYANVSVKPYFENFSFSTIDLTTSSLPSNRIFTANIKSLDGKIYSVNSINKNGKTVFSFNAPAGKYELSISGTSYTTYTDKSFALGKDNLPDSIEIYQGDINGDGVINAKDNALIAAAFGKRKGEDGYNENADFNGDFIINAKDRAIISSGFSKRNVTVD